MLYRLVLSIAVLQSVVSMAHAQSGPDAPSVESTEPAPAPDATPPQSAADAAAAQPEAAAAEATEPTPAEPTSVEPVESAEAGSQEDPAPAQETPTAAEEAPAPPSGLQVSASYDGPTSDGKLSVAALLGVGFSFQDTRGGINPFGLGMGLKLGYHLNQVYLGARGEYFVGGSAQLPTGELSMRSWLLGVEAGYDLDLAALVLRPSLVLGIATRTTDGPPTYSDTSGGAIPGTSTRASTDFYVSPGLTALLPLGPAFVGAELRLPLVFRYRVEVGLMLLATGGVRF